jgi:hypothetical protein
MNDAVAAKARIMLEMQDEMNARVDPDWIDRGREWYRAVWIECAELMDHYGGWKWWKKSAGDRDQALLEIVDIWHFGLSMRITPSRDFARAAAQIAVEWRQPVAGTGFLAGVERLALAALGERRFEVAAIPLLLAELGRDYDDLFRGYVGKNVLNFFRQDHGYRDGSYAKSWSGREDNEHLVEVLAGLDSNDAGFRAAVYDGLAARYRAACASR